LEFQEKTYWSSKRKRSGVPRENVLEFQEKNSGVPRENVVEFQEKGLVIE